MKLLTKAGYTVSLAGAVTLVAAGVAYGVASQVAVPEGQTVTATCTGPRLSTSRVDSTTVQLSCRANPTPPPGGLAISVSGNRLIDGNGAPVTLRGVNVSGSEFVCAQNWTDDAYGGQPLGDRNTFAAIASWRANVVRVPLNEDCWLDVNGVRVGGAAYQQAVRTEIAAAHAAGLYVVLDLHWSAPGSQRALSQNPMADLNHSVSFWQQVATAYKSDPAVLFDLYNEPYDYWGTGGGDQWSRWLNGGTQTQYVTGGNPYTVTANWQTAGMQRLLDSIRGTGATQPVIVNGLDWANDLTGWLSHRPSDPLNHLVAGQHVYPGQPGSSPSALNATTAAVASSVPVLVGETGDSSAGTPTFLPTFLPWADQHGVSYLAWTWNPWQDSNDVLIRDWNGTPTPGEGAYFRNHLLSLG